jgi:hypothetical protein
MQQITNFNVSIDEIVQGNNGNVLRLTVLRNKQPVSLVGATVTVAIKHGETLITKSAVITGAEAGECEITLNRADIAVTGLYFAQPTVVYDDGTEFSGDVIRFKVAGKLTGVPPVEQTPGDIGDITVTVDGGVF